MMKTKDYNHYPITVKLNKVRWKLDEIKYVTTQENGIACECKKMGFTALSVIQAKGARLRIAELWIGLKNKWIVAITLRT